MTISLLMCGKLGGESTLTSQIPMTSPSIPCFLSESSRDANPINCHILRPLPHTLFASEVVYPNKFHGKFHRPVVFSRWIFCHLELLLELRKLRMQAWPPGSWLWQVFLALGITKYIPYMDLVGFFDVAEYMFGEFPSKSCKKHETYHTIHLESKITQ